MSKKKKQNKSISENEQKDMAQKLAKIGVEIEDHKTPQEIEKERLLRLGKIIK